MVVTIAAGDIKGIDVAPPNDRRAFLIRGPKRAFPDANCGRVITITAPQTATASVGSSDINIGDASHQPAFVFEHSSYAPVAYNLGMFGVLSADVPLGPVGGAPTEAHVGRIDVDLVAVKKNDGSTVPTPGTYEIRQVFAGAGGKPETFGRSFCLNSATKTGVDVLPGTYEITTTYNTVETGTKTDVQRITIQ
jgi:hypothetical protein